MLKNLRRITLFFFILLPLIANSQKVGVVLSGGGSSGLAHIGVLKALEEHNIPIDYICGTSMGGVVGSFYAAGFSPDSIEKLFVSDELNYALSGSVKNNYNFYYGKQEDNASWLKLAVKLDSAFNLSFRQNLIKDYNLNFLLAQYLGTASQVANYNFDSLFVPYRALASDIFTQKEEILKKGGLNEAARVTSTVPLFYRPVKVNDKYLFDGGIYNNFPVDVMQKEFAPDVIIGVNVSDKRFMEYPYEDDDKLINNYIVMMFLNNTDSTKIRNGVYIEPNTDSYASTDFKSPQAIIDSGYVKTLSLIDKLKSKVNEEVSSEDVATRRAAFNQKKEEFQFGELKLQGFRKNQEKYIRRLFKIKDDNYLALNSVKKNYYRLVAEQYFQDVFSTTSFDKEKGYYSFVLQGKPEKEIDLSVGGNIASRNISNIYLGLDLTYLNNLLNQFHVDLYSGRFYQSAQLRAKIKFPTTPSFYVEPIATFNNWDFLNTNDFLSDDKELTIIDRVDRAVGINIALPSGTRSKIVLNASYINNLDRFSNLTTLESPDTLDRLTMEGSKFSFLYSRNSLNRKLYASEGSALDFKVKLINLHGRYIPGSTSAITNNVTENYNWVNVSFRYEQYIKANWFRYGYLLRGEYSSQPVLFNYRTTELYSPAFFPLQDSKTLFLNDLRAYQYAAGGIRLVATTKANIDIRAEGYIFKPIRNFKENSNQGVSFDNDNLEFSLIGTLGAVYHSPIGPLSASLNYYENKTRPLGVLIHFGYLLFNNRSEE